MDGPLFHRPPRRNRRLEPNVYSLAGQPCFFTLRAARDRAPFRLPRYADLAVECLLAQQAKSNCRLDVYCVMPDHLHLVVTPVVDGASSTQFVDRFKGWCSRAMRQAGWEGYLWQPGSYDHVVRKDESLLRIGAYILYNRVRKGLCTDPDQYPWSGIILPNGGE